MKWTTQYPYAPSNSHNGIGGSGCEMQPHRCSSFCRTFVRNGKKMITHYAESGVVPTTKASPKKGGR